MNELPIGIFDSGVGGLTVYRALHDRLPNEHFVYLGDTATIEIEYDPRPRVFEMRKVLRAALAADKKAKAAFDALTPSRRTEIIRYLGSLKTEVSIKQNVEKVLKRLLVG